MLSRGLDVPELHAEQHEIDGSDCGGIVARLDRADHRLAAVAFHAQSVGAHGGKMRAARHEDDILSRAGERCAERRADAPGADDGNAHAKPPVFASDGRLTAAAGRSADNRALIASWKGEQIAAREAVGICRRPYPCGSAERASVIPPWTKSDVRAAQGGYPVRDRPAP